jgi:hypothetical protein
MIVPGWLNKLTPLLLRVSPRVVAIKVAGLLVNRG